MEIYYQDELPKHTFYTDFDIADISGIKAILDTHKRAFKNWKSDYKMLTALTITLNHKIWQHYENDNQTLAQLYNTLWIKTDTYAYNNLKGSELDYFIKLTD